jgi:NAD(P) transhydrogenase subunit alpha
MEIGVPVEAEPGERRVAITPDVTRKLVGAGHKVTIASGAGTRAGLTNDSFSEMGARIGGAAEALSQPFVAVVNAPEPDGLRAGSILLGLLRPFEQPRVMADLARAGVAAIAFELIPRSTRAQAMDALSSQATVAGYQAALVAADACTRLLPMLTTAAGTIRPARVLVLGAGVAGLQAIATCRRLGAVVSGFDVRAAAAEQVRSLGAIFVEVDMTPQDGGAYARELETDAGQLVLQGLAGPVASSDVVIATAAIPGRRAPLLVTEAMVAAMKPGSVIVDLAASTGGNCQLTRPGEIVTSNGVTIIGYTDLAARKPFDASQMYARNVAAVLALIDETGDLDFGDEILDQATVTYGGAIRLPQIQTLLDLQA